MLVAVESITIRGTGIIQFTNNQIDDLGLPNLVTFKIEDQNVDYVSRFFINFPKIKFIRLANCRINAVRIANSEPFITQQPLDFLELRNNSYSIADASFQARLFLNLLRSIKVSEITTLIIDDNRFPITKESVKKFDQISQIKRMEIRGSVFDDYISLQKVFLKFTNLEYLDLSETKFPYFHSGALAGLPKINILKLMGNEFRDLSEINIFAGITSSNLSVIDLSNNSLRKLPIGFDVIGENVTELYLDGNLLDTTDFWENGQFLPNIRVLGLSSNEMTKSSGLFMSKMKTLEILDMSCNKFEILAKKFFQSLPASLKVLNLTFCSQEERLRPRFEHDAFSKFPKIKALHLGSGFFKSHILMILQVKSA